VKEAAQSPNLIRFESFEVNLGAGELCKSGEKVKLPEQSFQILAMLLERPGEVVMRREIQKRLWPNDTVVEFENSINAAVKRLRLALRDPADHPRYVETLARRGYRWMIPIECAEACTPGPRALDSLVPRAETPTASLTGKKVSHYRVLEILGGGGMGVVYKAEDIKLGRRVALKFLPQELAPDTAAMERFEREARAASALNHPNICTIYEVEEYAGQPFIVMELLEGQTLRELISARQAPSWQTGAQKGPLPLEILFDLALQIAEGLDAAHQKGIIHRDIKPANIFVTIHGQAKVLDFGLAKLQGTETPDLPSSIASEAESQEVSNLTLTGAAMGTAGYMSPEQVRGEKLDARTDLFSFGLVLYEMAVGQRAFTGETTPVLHDAILNHTPTSVRELNPELTPQLAGIINKALEKDRELRYQSAAEMRADLQYVKRKQDSETGRAAKATVSSTKVRFEETQEFYRNKLWRILLPVVLVFAFAFMLARSFRSRSAKQLTNRDTIVLADFANSTGDTIFDDTLKQALRAALRQSPFLNILPDGKVSATLKLMTRPVNTPLTPEMALEVCQRADSKAYIAGAVAALGSEYVLGLKAVHCQSGRILAQQQVTAEGKERVLKALGSAAIKLREELGESLATVGKFDVPLDQTTPSLEALKAYNLGMKAGSEKGPGEQLVYDLRAVQIDPNFAMAYLSAGVDYTNMNQGGRASEYLGKAFELRDHANERERLEISSLYYYTVTGELDKAAQTYQKTIEDYPASPSPYGNLSVVYAIQGRYEMAAEMARKVLRVFPGFGGEAYEGIAQHLLSLQRFDEARLTIHAALERKVDTAGVHKQLYALSFLAGDSKALAEQVAWFESKPEYENLGLSLEADTAAYAGYLRKSRELTRRAVDSALRADNKESAAMWWDNAALREAAFGNTAQARRAATEALKIASTNQAVEIEAALALAMAGDKARAGSLMQNLRKRFPLDTQVQSVWLPTIDAQLALLRKRHAAAIDRLQTVTPTELGYVPFMSNVSCLYTVYVRGEAYLASGDGASATREFQKILDHNGIVWNCPSGALAHLGLARANALEAQSNQGIAADAARSRALAAYRDFLALWRDSDPDVPILKQAKSEYAKLQ